MTEVVRIGNAELHLGDCLEVLRTLPDASIEAIVTDPPAGIGFMGKDWDHHKGGRQQWVAWMTDIAAECLRVLKPGGHALVWAIPRTSHWTATAWEDAGFEIRDRIAHCFGGGFPKSLDVSKALDKMAGAEREVVGQKAVTCGTGDAFGKSVGTGHKGTVVDITAPATPAAKQLAGWGTALKPAIEDWWLCRKPLDGTVAWNVLKHGCGGLNIDGCRVDASNGRPLIEGESEASLHAFGNGLNGSRCAGITTQGRWPSHLIHDGSDEVVGLFPETGPSKATPRFNRVDNPVNDNDPGASMLGRKRAITTYGHKDTGGSAARFFYCAKASKADRDEGCEGLPQHDTSLKYNGGDGFAGRTQVDGEWVNTDKANRVKPRNHHPTVKPTALMTYLCRMITPPGGTVLDPFMGSGSTGKAAMLEGFRFIGIEREAEYLAIAKARISAAQRQPDLFHQEAA